jgi:serine protease AprX
MAGTSHNNQNGEGPLKTTTWGARLALLALIALLAAGMCLADGNKHKLSKDLGALRGGHNGATVDVIIQFNQTPTAAHHRKVQNRGGVLKTKLDVIKGAHYTVPTEALEGLANDPDVVFISPNRPVNGALDHVVHAVNADIAFSQGWDGTGIGIAVVDSGVGLHDDLYTDRGTLAPRVVYSQSFVAGDSSTTDAYGHGTHVAGIISSNGTDSLQERYPGVYRGIAPEATILNLRALDANGAGTDSSVIAAIQQTINLKSTYNIRVLNVSLGRPVYESYTLDPLCQAVEAAWNAGIVVVVAAGNSGRDTSLGTQGYATIGAPGNDPYVITVGATNLHGTFSQASQTITSYSSKGPTLIDHVVKPDLAAPGNRVVSLLASNTTLPNTYPSLDVFPCNSTGTQCNSSYGAAQYFRLSGTSMATPVVSGAAALLLQQNPGLTPDQVKARLMKTAWKGYGHYISETDSYGTNHSLQHDLFAVGAGFVDAEAALSSTDLAPATLGSAKSPSVNYDPLTGTVYLVTDPNSVWNSSVVWGTSVVWGASVFGGTTVQGYSVVWGDSVVWGTSLDQGFSVVWGDSVVWGASVTQAFSAGDDGDE